MGIAPLCYQAHELYPDLARQVLATATITYQDSSAPSYANYSFSFMADGEYCSLSLDKLNEIYEIVNEPRGVAVAKKFAPSNAFWDFIANGNFTPGKAYQSQIRNPALRVIAKIISNLLFAKDQTSKVTNGELQTQYAGIEDEIRASGSGIPIQKDRSGSLLTPLFKHFGIDLSKYKVNTEIQYVGILPYEKALRKKESRCPTKARNRSLRSDRTSVPLGRYVATELEPETLADLGIDEDVFETLQAMGIAPLCYQAHELYPDLARQVLATATITYEDSSAPSYANCSFSFMADGQYCSLSLDKLNEIYEIANEPRGVAVAKKFAPSNAFWDFIANGNFTPGKAYQSQIRNPALRVIAKIISNLLFAK
ncbi:hypothetical protein F2Q69_00042917 [Brassica cretica]|uniref:Arabidopsis retrotransposon Orf1 C-terminal domain-containing protein n=1 Tax=Brassica cretica TaxID=69181 RepID=A0A8S9NRS4_BRACR|nr:hypothetical protein F2Q69_00042917 [Brassica cretica]